MKNIDHHCARKFGHIYGFIDDLITTNDNKEFENSLKKENANENVATFLYLNTTIKEGKFSTGLRTVLYIKGMDLIFLWI